jgi:thymidylate synthase
MIVADRIIVAPNISVAWADAVACLADRRPHRSVNLTIRIEDPLSEDPRIRAVADEAVADLELQEIAEVANTIFPSEWALDFADPAELAADYREHYEFIRGLGNTFGTYFGRMVAYPDPTRSATVDQLTKNVQKLRKGTARRRIYSSIYEFNIYSAVTDSNKERGFPCLAHLGMHVGPDQRLSATAQYRNHDVVAKGYGNYLGLGGLLGYVARATDHEPGELLVVAGGASFEASVTAVRATRVKLEPFRAATR